MITAIFKETKRTTCCACTRRRICTRIRVTWVPTNYSPFTHHSDNEWICNECLKDHKADGRVNLDYEY